jgi:flagellar hook-length control protein FliK
MIQNIAFCEKSAPNTPTPAQAKTVSFKDYHEAAIKNEATSDAAAQTSKDTSVDAEETKSAVQTSEETQAENTAAPADEQPPDTLKTLTEDSEKTGEETKDGAETKVKDEDGLKEETTVSMCQGSGLENLTNGIVGILEGFGLLNNDTGNNTLPEELQNIVTSATTQTDGTADAPIPANNVQQEAANEFPEIIARMPQNDQTGNLQAAKAQVTQLVSEYLSSFANVNNQGADEQDGAGTDNTVQTGTKEQALQNVADKLMAMLSEAYAKKDVSTQKQAADTADQSTADTMTATAGESDAATTATAAFQLGEAPKAVQTQTAAAKTENTAGTAQASQYAKENAANIVEKISVMAKDGIQECDISLKPEHLGKLTIKLTMDSDGIKAHIKAADNTVKGLIADQIPALQESLKEKGIQLTHVEVTFEKPMFGQEQSKSQYFQQNGSKKNLRLNMLEISGAPYETLMDTTGLYTNSSMEFSA